jgi:hypothetical protein
MESKAPDFVPHPFGETVKQWMPILLRLVKDRLKANPLTFAVAGPRAFSRAVRLLRLLGRDIFDGGAAFRLCGGWHSLEDTGGITFRWAHYNSEFALCFQDGSTRLGMLVEPGPSLGFEPFDLVLRMDGEEIGRQRVRGVSYVEFDLPIRQGEEVLLNLNPENPGGAWGQPVPGDVRTLNYRVLVCGRGTPPDAPPPDPAPKGGMWPTRLLATRPAETDWVADLAPQAKAIAEMGRPHFLHLYACGDFQMMACEDWEDVRGYPELDEFSMHLDSVFSYAAYYSGKEEVFLPDPMRIYHIEHGIGSGWTPEGHNALMERITRKGISQLVFADVAAMVAQMRRLHAPMIFNLDNWGMAGEQLRETVLDGVETVS